MPVFEFEYVVFGKTRVKGNTLAEAQAYLMGNPTSVEVVAGQNDYGVDICIIDVRQADQCKEHYDTAGVDFSGRDLSENRMLSDLLDNPVRPIAVRDYLKQLRSIAE